MALIRIAAILKPSKMADIWRLFGWLAQFPSLARNRTTFLSLTNIVICKFHGKCLRLPPALFSFECQSKRQELRKRVCLLSPFIREQSECESMLSENRVATASQSRTRRVRRNPNRCSEEVGWLSKVLSTFLFPKSCSDLFLGRPPECHSSSKYCLCSGDTQTGYHRGMIN
ncbi:hypothetical protein AVEN_121693-1 [Araneus ventricosus]|uniref:Uncharacterized protein n=1 Tax=Araneus ventricosus TaxID=182803 RepID=A0A4Y2BFF8_ARAVE|nr:hypothetical protein AVEN_180812-1 [Araneus ventricosus]GBL91049.1 hypothetical protein AVEN_121693-1 [Araneus ventricosus]